MDRLGAAHPKPCVLVLDDNTRVPQWFRDHFGNGYTVLGAGGITAALEQLGQRDVRVIVTSDSVGGESTLGFLCALKERQPAVMALVLTAAHDATMVVRLIGEAKVSRVLFKPVKPGAVELALGAAMRQHLEARDAARIARARAAAGASNDARGSLLERMRAKVGWPGRVSRVGT